MRDKWEKARGTIVESPDAPPGATGPTYSVGLRSSHDYVVEVAAPRGQMLRAVVSMTSKFIHAVGEPMAVEVNVKTGEVRLDAERMSLILHAQAQEHALNLRLAREAQAATTTDGDSGPSVAIP
jgi:hypothetical protein